MTWSPLVLLAWYVDASWFGVVIGVSQAALVLAASCQKHLGPTVETESARCTHQQLKTEQWPWGGCIDVRSFRPNKSGNTNT